MTNTTNTTNNPQTRMNTSPADRRHYWNGTKSAPMPQTSRAEKIFATLAMIVMGTILCTAYAKILIHHDAAAVRAYSNR